MGLTPKEERHCFHRFTSTHSGKQTFTSYKEKKEFWKSTLTKKKKTAANKGKHRKNYTHGKTNKQTKQNNSFEEHVAHNTQYTPDRLLDHLHSSQKEKN